MFRYQNVVRLFRFLIFGFLFWGFQAWTAGYSETCNDYLALQYPSKEQCLRDGRWHLVFENSQGGAAVFGSLADLQVHLVAGAEFKVVVPNIMGEGRSGNERCQQMYKAQLKSNVYYCLTAARFAGEETGVHGSARYGTDGSLYCNSHMMMSGLAPTTSLCGGLTLGYKWYVRY